MKIVITADGRNLAATTGGQPLTSGSVGIEAAFILSADYDDLAVTAVFSAGETRVDVLLTKPCCIVPWEVLQEPKATLFVGVVGKNGSGEIVIPTVWGRVGMIECGTVADGLDPEDPTPDIAAQILQQAREALAEAAETKEAAAQSAETAGNEADRAEAAKQAIEDLGVTVHEDPDGPSVEKTVDPETGAVTLDFGFKPAGVTEVNGQTGAVSLDLDDIPDGAQYVRPTPAQVQQIGTNKDDIADIEDLIPNQATPQNQLADKDFVNSSINSSAAFFRGAFPTRAALFAVAWQTSDPTGANYVSNNDYAYVADDETHNDEAWRYLYVLQPGGTDNGWQPQFRVNESPLTAAQLAALNSGATAEIIASIADKYELPEGGMPSADMSDDVRASLQKADTALQAVPDTYRTAAEQDAIDQAQDERIDSAAQATTATTLGPAAVATFDASAADMPLKGLTVDIEPVQEGSGDPSPENVRPISGWTGCNVVRTGKNLIDDTDTIAGYLTSIGYVGGETDPTNRHTKKCNIKGGVEYHLRFDTSYTALIRACIYRKNGTWLTTIDIPANTDHLTFVAPPESDTISVTLRGNQQHCWLTLEDTPDYTPYNGGSYPITFPTEAGTVYGGTLMINADGSGELAVDKIAVKIKDAVFNWNRDNGGTPFFKGNSKLYPTGDFAICDCYKDAGAIIASNQNTGFHLYTRAQTDNLRVRDSAFLDSSVSDWLAARGDNYICYQITNPTTYQLTVEQVTTLLGTNNIWADCGDVTVTYGAYLETVKAHAERLGDSILSAIAPLEASYTASRTYAVGSYLFVGTKFYKVTAAIGSGDTINPGTNVTQTTVAAQLMELA